MAAPDRQRADEALDWVRRIHDPSFADWEGHAAWLEADPRNLELFEDASFTIEAATAGLSPAEPFVLPARAVNDNPAATRRRPSRWATGIGMAAAAMIVATLAAPTLLHDRAQPYRVRTGAGERRTVTLDGTTVTLNGGSRLRLDRADPRVATLEEGEAFFAVRHDATHPFVVHAGGATFQDVGTAFDVVERPGSTRMAVREGAVLYDPGGSAVRVGGGQSIRIEGDAATVRPVDTAGVGGWQTGRLLYRDASLADVAGDVARSIGEPVTIDPALTQRRFSGVVQIDADHARMFRRMAAIMGVTIRHAGPGWQMVVPSR